MCGIVGFAAKQDDKLLQKQLGEIIHRGPDGEGIHTDQKFSIGMRRLAIIDPEDGWQPIWNEDKTVAIVFNGEIYNYQKLWKQLEQLGHKFSTDHSDTETVVHGYEEWGIDVVKRLRGMFAFIIYDLKRNRLFIARDRLGIKPLYYFNNSHGIFFASEIKALLKTGYISPKVNREVLSEYLRFRIHDHRPETFFSGILRLPPSHLMVVNSNRKIERLESYWKPEVNTSFKSTKKDSVYADELREIFEETMKLHLISDVPIAVSLSGGLDSTGVLSMTKKLRDDGQDLHTKGLLTFSAVYPGDPIDESRYIDEAIQYTGAEKHIVEPTVEGFWSEINDWIYTQEEPTISSAPYASYSVMREAHKYIKVILSGQGGDELFAGYIPYFASYFKTALPAGRGLRGLYELLRGADLYFPFFKRVLQAKLSRNNALSMGQFLEKGAFEKRNFTYNQESNLNMRLWKDVSSYSVPNILRYEDRNAMAFSIETRVPLLDHKFVEYVLGLPADQKIKHGWNRFVYRNAMKGLMPESIRSRRKKIGFTTPEARWMRSKSNRFEELLGSDKAFSSGLFQQDTVVKAFKAWKSGKINGDAMVFWRILNTELWMRKFNITL
ncbi:MAG: asparagine synthase (glutamine-hydrolyzing) [Candidatus Dojkabacteria bacterium]